MKNKSNIFENIIYEIVMGVLAAIAVGIALYDIVKGGNIAVLKISDRVIWIIFIADYVVRLILSENKLSYIRSNIWELIAILPFNSLFRAFRLVKLVRLTRLVKIAKFARLVSFAERGIKRCREFLDTNGFKYMLIVTLVVIILGAVGISFAENMMFKDALWWSFVTTATVGYGDISPASDTGRVIACILMLVGIGLIGSLTSTITSFFMKGSEKNKSYRQSEIDNIKSYLDRIDELSGEEIEDICAAIRRHSRH